MVAAVMVGGRSSRGSRPGVYDGALCSCSCWCWWWLSGGSVIVAVLVVAHWRLNAGSVLLVVVVVVMAQWWLSGGGSVVLVNSTNQHHSSNLNRCCHSGCSSGNTTTPSPTTTLKSSSGNGSGYHRRCITISTAALILHLQRYLKNTSPSRIPFTKGRAVAPNTPHQ